MSGRIGKRACGWVLLALLAAVPAASAEQATYVVRGLGGAALWGVGEQTGTEAIALAFADATPEKGDPPLAGPRLVFSVTQWAPTDGAWARRRWYGDVPLDKNTLDIALDLTKGALDATVEGTLEEQRLDGSVLRRQVKGTIAIRWAATGGIAQSSSTFTYQSNGSSTILQSVGTGRQSLATGTVTVDGFGAPLKILGLGQLASLDDGRLSVQWK